MTTMLTRVMGACQAVRCFKPAAICALVLAMPLALNADPARHDGGRDDRDRRERRDGDDHRGRGGRLDVRIGVGSMFPSPPTVVECVQQVWVPPVYTVVTQRVWVDATAQRVVERVLVPDRYEWREVAHVDSWRRWVTREYVLAEAAHYEDQTREVIAPAHLEDVQQQQLVAPGHWEARVVPMVIAPPRPRAGFEIRFPIH